MKKSIKYLYDFKLLKKFDTHKMYQVYDDWPIISENAYFNELETIPFTVKKHVVFVGMGGSGTIGDIFSSILSKTDLHVSVVKGYLLPKTVNKDSLVILTSVSGNTDETINVLKSSKQIGCKCISFSSGGKMEMYCRKNNLEYRKIEQIHSPRASLTQYIFSMIKILSPIIPIDDKTIMDTINKLKELKMEIDSNRFTKENPAVDFATWINHPPTIYYPAGLGAAAIRFKNSLQENSKMHVITEDVIEACHNGIVSWEKDSPFKPILIQGKNDFHKTQERWKILKEYFYTKNIEYREISSVEGNIFSKLINLIYFFDYVSIYNAVINQIDPSPVKSIQFIKNRLLDKS